MNEDQRTMIMAIATITLFIAVAISPVHGQQAIGQSFTFSDRSLQPSSMGVFQESNGSMMDIGNVSSSGGRIIYDPTSDYTFIFEPTIENTYATSPEGVIGYLVDNPEISAIVIVVIIVAFIVLSVVGLAVIVLLKRRK